MISSNSTEQWPAEGAQTAEQRANKKYKQLLKEYQPPPLDPTIEKVLLAFISQRKAEIRSK